MAMDLRNSNLLVTGNDTGQINASFSQIQQLLPNVVTFDDLELYVTRGQASVTLVNGDNDNVGVPDGVGHLLCTGPTAACAVSGFTNPLEDRYLTVHFDFSQTVTIYDEDTGSDAANRIGCGGANVVLVGPCAAFIKYEVVNERWVYIGGSPARLANLGDVTISSVADNEVIAYDSGSSKYINQTAAEANLVDLSSTQTITGAKTFTGGVVCGDETDVGTINNILYKEFSWNPGSLDDGQSDSTSVAVSTATTGSIAIAGTDFGADGDKWTISASVNSSGSVTVTIVNHTGSTVNLGSQTFRVLVFECS